MDCVEVCEELRGYVFSRACDQEFVLFSIGNLSEVVVVDLGKVGEVVTAQLDDVVVYAGDVGSIVYELVRKEVFIL